MPIGHFENLVLSVAGKKDQDEDELEAGENEEIEEVSTVVAICFTVWPCLISVLRMQRDRVRAADGG